MAGISIAIMGMVIMKVNHITGKGIMEKDIVNTMNTMNTNIEENLIGMNIMDVDAMGMDKKCLTIIINSNTKANGTKAIKDIIEDIETVKNAKILQAHQASQAIAGNKRDTKTRKMIVIRSKTIKWLKRNHPKAKNSQTSNQNQSNRLSCPENQCKRPKKNQQNTLSSKFDNLFINGTRRTETKSAKT